MGKKQILYYLYSCSPKSNTMPEELSQFGIYKTMKEVISTITKRKEHFIWHIFTNPENGFWSPIYYGQVSNEVSLITVQEHEFTDNTSSGHHKQGTKSFRSY